MSRNGRRLSLDLHTETLWLIRWEEPDGRILTTARMTLEGAQVCALAKVRPGGRAPLVYRVGVDWIEREHVDFPEPVPVPRKPRCEKPPAETPEERAARMDAMYGPTIWRGGSSASDAASTCHTGPDAASVESVEVGSPGGPAADLLDLADVVRD